MTVAGWKKQTITDRKKKEALSAISRDAKECIGGSEESQYDLPKRKIGFMWSSKGKGRETRLRDDAKA